VKGELGGACAAYGRAKVRYAFMPRLFRILGVVIQQLRRSNNPR
jgi:hypothetical protein